MNTILGYALISIPFIAIFIFGLKTIGWRGTLFAFGLTATIAAIIGVGFYLLSLG